jgi:glycosyltransferase involved in cell wall biosynthesis
MHISEIAPLAESVPPSHYGGTERVVSWLTDELVGLGEKVTLFASGGSKTKADLVAISPKPLRLSRPPIDPMSALTALLECVARRAKEFDVIHCHLDWIHIPLLRRLGRPFLTTLHGRLDLPQMHSFAASFADAPFVSISNAQRAPLAELNFVDTIYHGIPEQLLRPNLQPAGYLAFLGRFTHEKGPHIAIRLARQTHLPLRIAAKIPRMETQYFKEQIEPLLDGHQVEFVGEVNDGQKQDFLGNAMAVLFPIDWPADGWRGGRGHRSRLTAEPRKSERTYRGLLDATSEIFQCAVLAKGDCTAERAPLGNITASAELIVAARGRFNDGASLGWTAARFTSGWIDPIPSRCR